MSMANRHQVEIVSMDMWKPYRRAFQTVLPQARIVVDKFHVVRMANEALEKIRKGLRKELKPNHPRWKNAPVTERSGEFLEPGVSRSKPE